MDPLARLLFAVALVATLAAPASSLADDDDGGARAGAINASGVTHNSAQITGTLVPGEKQTTWWITYGWSYGTIKSTAPVTVPGDESHKPVTVTAKLTGLPAATAVYARLVADSKGASSEGKIAWFKTAAAPGSAAPAAKDPSGSAPADPTQPGGPGPELGKTVVVAEASGVVRIRLRGSDEFIGLEAATSIPVGSVVDASRGSVALNAARSAAGASQEARFGGGRFVIRQSHDGRGYTDLYLRGRGFGRCADRDAGAVASAAAKRRKGVRRLWGRDHGGRFRTHGRDSVATVRGTRWTMIDRCDGTLTKVTEGAVDVKVRRTGRVVRVNAGERHLARHRR